MKKRATVLGGGLVGLTMARELASDEAYEVTVADSSATNLSRLAGLPRLTPRQADLGNEEQLRSAIGDADVVLGALPSRMGIRTWETVLRAGKRYCDISFLPEDPLLFDEMAKEHGATAVFDCGVSPGLSNMMVGFARSQLDDAERAEIFVGGLPRARHWPFQYKAPFAPSDVIEEYTRPARMREQGQFVVKPALSEPERIEVSGVGTLEAFNTDGLRSLLSTMDIPNLREKTLRYPGHIEIMKVFREIGLFGCDPIDIQGTWIRPIDVCSKLLFPKWKLDECEPEFTYLKVEVVGIRDGQGTRHVFELFDEFDSKRKMSSMARTTAFPCVIVAKMLAEGRVAGPGVLAPENIAGFPDLFNEIVSQLRDRGVRITHCVERVA